MQTADLHMHSHYSRATSPDMNIEAIARAAKVKGVDIIGTGDFTHPLWMKELKAKLTDVGGIYEYDGTKFVISGEISLIYKKNGKQRRVHHIILAPDFPTADQINDYLSRKGRRDYDGRPIFGIDSIELVDSLMKISREIEVIPAHAWTSWYGIFGSMSGFDSLEECFEEKTKHIHAIETGMSSDPAMNWRIPFLDDITLVSNSDSHSPHPWRLGREANVFDLKKVDYSSIISAIRSRKGFAHTIETYPEYGKYHVDGHSACNFSCTPEETKKLKGICPKCNKPLIIGVQSRINELAGRKEGYKPKDSIPFKAVIPLHELVSFSIGAGIATQKTQQVCSLLLNRFGSELNILLDVKKQDLEKVAGEKIADIIERNRSGSLKFVPGYDGVYGKIASETQSSLNKWTCR
jgi:uncharacterized protein (TIGR00375 family)